MDPSSSKLVPLNGNGEVSLRDYFGSLLHDNEPLCVCHTKTRDRSRSMRGGG